jgi:hypothetical protein
MDGDLRIGVIEDGEPGSAAVECTRKPHIAEGEAPAAARSSGLRCRRDLPRPVFRRCTKARGSRGQT